MSVGNSVTYLPPELRPPRTSSFASLNKNFALLKPNKTVTEWLLRPVGGMDVTAAENDTASRTWDVWLCIHVQPCRKMALIGGPNDSVIAPLFKPKGKSVRRRPSSAAEGKGRPATWLSEALRSFRSIPPTMACLRWRRCVPVQAAVALLCLLGLLLPGRREGGGRPPDGPPSAALAVVVCDATAGGAAEESPAEGARTPGGSGRLRSSWRRQREQLRTMLKTLLYFGGSAVWRVVVVTDTDATFRRVVGLAGETEGPQGARLRLERRPVWFPEEQGALRDHWRPCAWAKLFLAEALPEEDAVVYLDTDVVFLGPAEELWRLLEWTTEAAVALAPEPQYKAEEGSSGRSYGGRNGLSTGVMALNLTRLRRLPGGGLGSAIVLEGAVRPEPRHDQDALNHFLSRRPRLLKEVTSRWNFLPSSCFPDAPPCPDCLSQGILLLHGSDVTFYRHIDSKYLAMYSSLVSLSLDDDPMLLLAKIENKLALVDAQKTHFPCSNYTHLNHALTLGLKNALASIYANRLTSYT